MSENIFSQACTRLKYENFFFFGGLDFCYIQLLFFCFVLFCVGFFFFPKGRAVSHSFYDTNFSLETFYKTKCGIRK